MKKTASISSSPSTAAMSDGRLAPVFIVGCGHSGTTKLCSLLNEHPDICCAYETAFFIKNPEKNVSLPLKMNDKTYVAHLNPDVPSSTWAHAVDSALSSYCSYQKNRVTMRWTEKTPKHVLYLGDILQEFPNSRVILTVRNGFDSVCSFSRRDDRRDNNSSPAGMINDMESLYGLKRWVGDNIAALSYLHDERVLVVKLESFVANPRSALSKILSHTNLQSSADIIDSILHNRHDKTALDFAPQLAKLKVASPHQSKRSKQMKLPISGDVLSESSWCGCIEDGIVSSELAELLQNDGSSTWTNSSGAHDLLVSFHKLMEVFNYTATYKC